MIGPNDSIPMVMIPMPKLSDVISEQQQDGFDANDEFGDMSTGYEDTPAGSSVSPGKRGRSRSRSKSGSGRKGGKTSRSNSVARKKEEGEGTGGGNTKGLRLFSLAVCNKVREKERTTYNEVADELVKDYEDDEGKSDEKNIRRRVYDALNVLSAMGIIRKVKKDIIWVGLPASTSAELVRLESDVQSRQDRVSKKEEHLVELMNQFQLYSALIERNSKFTPPLGADKLALPFIVVSTNVRAKIDLRVSGDRSEYRFDFSHPFELHDDPHILQKMNVLSAVSQTNKDESGWTFPKK